MAYNIRTNYYLKEFGANNSTEYIKDIYIKKIKIGILPLRLSILKIKSLNLRKLYKQHSQPKYPK
jgi:hypothetical protein